MIKVTSKEFSQNTDKYLDNIYVDHEEVIVKKNGRLFKIVSLSPPCQYTIDELKNGIEKSLEDAENGRVYTIEEVKLLFEIRSLDEQRKRVSDKIDSIELGEMILKFIETLESEEAKPSSMFKDKDAIERLIEKREQFKNSARE